jgi:Uma2 family endonuclease
MLTDIPATAIDIYRMLPEGTRCEVIFNELSMSPSPTSDHQRLSMKLALLLGNFLNNKNLGEVIAAPMDVYFDDELSVIQPDLLVLLNQHLHYIKPDGIYGPPDLIIEILSPNNRLQDTQKKKNLYEKGGVKEYFIVDPETKEASLFQLNKNGTYDLAYQEKNIVRSALLGFTLDF